MCIMSLDDPGSFHFQNLDILKRVDNLEMVQALKSTKIHGNNWQQRSPRR